MVFTTFNNPACLPPRDNQQNIPPTRETTLCLTPNKQIVLQYKKNSFGHIYRISIRRKGKPMQRKTI